jgi:hypothetical protein
MTWLADHRATHGPDSYCEGCRPPDGSSVRTAAAPAPPARARAYAGLRPDLVIEPGTNRK